jgi:N,N-dimethylformamidase
LAESKDRSNIYVLTPGGAVFSTESIGWAASLAPAGYSNEVARITANVLRRTIDPTPFDS